LDHHLILGREYYKAHGHGNDYLVFREDEGWPVTVDTVRRVCHRQRGVGGDGIVAVLSQRERGSSEAREGQAPEKAPFLLRMFNPDGSEFERSGNGLRIAGAYLYSEGKLGLGEPVPLEVGGDRVELQVLQEEPTGALQVSVEMGPARFGLASVGGGVGGGEGPVEVVGPTGDGLIAQPVSVGNPHCVLFRDSLQVEELLELGPHLAAHPVFPHGINVQLARVVESQCVEILIWERGVGRTAASGTSACAVAAASVREGLLAPGRIAVRMEGGEFAVSVSPDMVIGLEGPVEPVCAGELSDALTRGLWAARS
jgi:diaminopimelate epimerase